ncbi:hypothetical protein KAT73_00210 [candidate division WOR-3 bacterium]|nr:hypothetical protein [candidate division WOR-3 bacterium]
MILNNEIATLTAFARNDNFFCVIARRPSYFLTDNLPDGLPAGRQAKQSHLRVDSYRKMRLKRYSKQLKVSYYLSSKEFGSMPIFLIIVKALLITI